MPGVNHTVLSGVGNSQVFLGRHVLLEWPTPPSHPRGRNYGAVGLRIPSLNNLAKRAPRESQARTTDGVIQDCKWKDGGFEC